MGRSSRSRRRREARTVGSSTKAGLSPGTMVFVGERKCARSRVDIIDYNVEQVSEAQDVEVDQCFQLALADNSVTWINVNGIHDVALIESLGQHFGLHPMTLEDLVNTTQRPKVEEFGHYLLIVMKMMEFDRSNSAISIEHVSLILGDNVVLSFLEDEGDVFNSLRQRLRTGMGRIRHMKADYLAYALMDAVVDHYFQAIEQIGDRIEEIDDKILEDPSPDDIQDIHYLKRDVLTLRKAAWPCREVISAIEKGESPVLTASTKVYWRDLYDHTIQVIDMVETYRDILGGMHDTYLSSLSNRMNEVMKTLTIISSIFIPLTFIAGVYGMNFEHMPELRWRLGYQGALALMSLIGVSLVIYFRRKRWL
ncbi:magnesium/cobalt transporter CorA [Synechococcus sp. Cruz-9H2]|uniref:magnesium/cobalt transporter CorA n=1 Tax=unclassified Synechococcus TaxID=2626047 RepID=UPI0020CC31C7|nr:MULTISPECIES: magnesium/cobalt transporter CorA [unclassified Synechococcus]MCP9819652.1 magnesium/cobalt transporter CorA [Synechococcus sp. Cruz-9H2]MCP9843957.1 magnesium/cobalt transporter CorA [Synechococcus sp. Edmonson 11F2]MCP9856082.1 magnesium/cobalt transporter CorA [Synechococcus sp. Cruz-9C9]MCP9863366.1 magnesium/cobalt transporter CorA [Synechococcus sp. Cruz-7E5]MCP9870607.1 magnesium/cobalt transporter CorA [Synechococcus sp. Cruz-7B9]